MPIDYYRWDALTVSSDEEEEVQERRSSESGQGKVAAELSLADDKGKKLLPSSR